LAVIVIIGAALQIYLTVHERESTARTVASGAGAVAVRGSAGTIRTFVSGVDGGETDASSEAEVSAAGPGAVSVAGDAKEISTRVTRGKEH
jgi:hypothetical protein